MKLISKIVQGLLGFVFLGSGGSKLVGNNEMVDDFDRYRYPEWFRVATGAVEVGGALGLLLGIFRPALTPLAGLLLGATMTGALATHAKVKDPAANGVTPGVLLGLATFVTLSRREALTEAKTNQVKQKG